jgi:undecaprenyl-diphosphatase
MVPEFLEVAPALWVECLKTNSYISAEFSFFLLSHHVCNGKKKCYYYKDGFVLTHDQINLLIIGNVIAFIGSLAIKSFIGF